MSSQGSLGIVRLPKAGRKWQVPRAWLRDLPGPLTYFLFGLLLGPGVLTIAPYAALTGVLVAEFASGSVAAGAVIGAAFGAGRVVALLRGSVAASRTSSEYGLVQGIANRMGGWQKTLGAAALMVAAIWAVTLSRL